LELVKSGIFGNYYNRELTEKLEFMGTDPVDVADSISTIAGKALEQDDKKALSALSSYVSVMLDHERSVNISVQEYYYLAALHKQFSNMEEAEKLLKYTIGLINKNTRVDELLLAECNDDLAYIYLENDNSAEAIPLFLRAGEILKRNYGVKHEAYLDNLNKLGNAYSGSRNYEESEKTYQEAIRIYEDSMKIVNTNSLGVKVNLAKSLC
jgi:tetratricopeptide (TPR) repeat protein